MPRLSVWFIRASLLYLLLGFLFGALLLAQKGISFYSPVWYIFPLHMEFLLMGWLVQLTMGVAFWILPRFSIGQSRGNKPLILISFALINAGTLIGILQFWFPVVLLIGRVSEVGAGIVFAAGLWRRVKPHGVL